VTGGTTVLSDHITVRVTANPRRIVPRSDDRSDRRRQAAKKTPNEISLNISAGGTDDHLPGRHHHAQAVPSFTRRRMSPRKRRPTCSPHLSVTVLVSLLVCLIPTTIGGLLSAIGIAGIDRMVQHKCVGDERPRRSRRRAMWTCCFLDKTGTIYASATVRRPISSPPRRASPPGRAGRRGATLEPCGRNPPKGEAWVVAGQEVWNSRARDS